MRKMDNIYIVFSIVTAFMITMMAVMIFLYCRCLSYYAHQFYKKRFRIENETLMARSSALRLNASTPTTRRLSSRFLNQEGDINIESMNIEAMNQWNDEVVVL